MADKLYLEPIGLTRRSLPGGRPLAGGPLFFRHCTLALWRQGEALRETLEVEALPGQAQAMLDRLTRPRADFAGLALDRPQIMGIINVTPDSFSDGGERFDAGRAVADGLAMWEAGARILDVGGESTRPGSAPVPLAEELRRVVPVVRALAGEGLRVSVDTRHAAVMAAAAEAGAAVINDVTALAGDPESLKVAADSGLALVLMHMQGEPATMQQDPRYRDVALEVYDGLEARLEACLEAGIAREKIALDPGIGFGKTLAHNLALLDRLALLHGLGCPLLVGASRKSFIGRVSLGEGPGDRLPGSLAAALAGRARGAQLFRVHDVPETAQALKVAEAIAAGGT